MERNKVLLVLVPGLLAAGWAAAAYLESPTAPDAAVASTEMTTVADYPGQPVTVAEAPSAHERSVPIDEAGVRVVNGRVDAHLQNARLAPTVARIARAAGIELVGEGTLADVPVRIDLDAVPAAEALLRLTAGYASAFEYHGSRVARMTIGPAPRAGVDESPLVDSDWANRFDRMGPEQRGDAIETIAAHGGDQAREAVAHALEDASEEVRFRALEQTQVVKGLSLPVDTVQKMLLQDASETVRLKALDVLATDPAIDANTLAMIAGSAGSDSSEQVRSQAAALRQRLEQSSNNSPQ